MTRLPHVPLILAFAVLLNGASGLHAQTPAAQPSAGVSATYSTGPAPRVISPGVADLLRAAAPKYSPPPADSALAANERDERELDRPRNGIIRLPRYLVEEPKIFLPNHRDVLTPKGRLELALKRRPGLRFGNIWFLRNDGIALFMLEEEERLERLREINDLMSLLPSPMRTDAVNATLQQLSIRSSEWSETGGSFQAHRRR